MTTNLLSVIEQLVDALNHCMDAITERGLNGSPDQAEKWGLQLPLARAESAITAAQSMLAHHTPSTTGEALVKLIPTAEELGAPQVLGCPLPQPSRHRGAGQQALEQTQVEAEPEWNDENVIAYCIARGISAAKAFTTGATQPQATEPAPSTAGEWVWDAADQTFVFQRKVAMNWFHVRRITPHAAAALLQSTADHIPDAGKMVAAMPVGELPEPFHPSASHINPDYRDGWNAALAAARSQPVREPLTNAQIEEGRKATFSTDNPFCPCDSKTMRKAVWWAERTHGITQGGKV